MLQLHALHLQHLLTAAGGWHRESVAAPQLDVHCDTAHVLPYGHASHYMRRSRLASTHPHICFDVLLRGSFAAQRIGCYCIADANCGIRHHAEACRCDCVCLA